MSILFDTRSLLDRERTGVGTFAHELAKTLLAQGQDVRFFMNASRGDIPPNDLPTDRITRTRHPNRLLNASMKLFGTPTIESLVAHCHSREGGNPEKKPEVLFLPNANFLATRLPFVTTVHDLSFEHFPEFFTAKQRLWHAAVDPIGLARRAAAVVAVSKNTAADLARTAGIDPAKIVVAYPGIDPIFATQTDDRIAAIRSKYALPKKFFLYVGAIEPRKNVPGLIEAFDLIDTDADLIIAGGHAWGWKDAARAAACANKKDRIRFLGYVPHEDKPALYAAASVFVYPSFYEGFGLPPLEAMACGTPVVASLTSSLGEIIDDAGLLVNPDSSRAIADAMTLTLEDRAIREMLRARGLDRAARFTWDSCARHVTQALKRAA